MLRLRPYRPSDAPVILSWCRDEAAFYKWTAGILGAYPITPAQFQKVADMMAFTAIDDDEIVGFFTMRRPGESFEELRFGFVTVDAQKRGKGYGRTMLRLGLIYAREIFGAKKVTLGVFENNLPARRCYQSIGFTEAAPMETYTIQGETWNCIELGIDL